MLKQKLVNSAEPYNPEALRGLGDASLMLMRQYKFPARYDPDLDKLINSDHDICLSENYKRTTDCVKKHTNQGECGIGYWAQKASDEKIIEFLKDILEADLSMEWTGYRILGSVHRNNGFPIWSLELFSKHPKSDTVVYTGEDAPNVWK
jgi:hypothetical protein